MNLITITHKDGLAFDVRVRRRRIATDMSLAEGGQGKGFTPAELLAGGLGACMAMRVQAYCEERGYGGGDVSVSLAFEFLGKPKRIGAIVADIDLPAGFPEEEKEEVRRIAEAAVICETLRKPPHVDLDIQFDRNHQTDRKAVSA